MKAPYLQIALDNESLEDAFHTLRGGLGSAAPLDILPAVWLSSALSVTAGLACARVLSRVWRA